MNTLCVGGHGLTLNGWTSFLREKFQNSLTNTLDVLDATVGDQPRPKQISILYICSDCWTISLTSVKRLRMPRKTINNLWNGTSLGSLEFERLLILQCSYTVPAENFAQLKPLRTEVYSLIYRQGTKSSGNENESKTHVLTGAENLYLKGHAALLFASLKMWLLVIPLERHVKHYSSIH